MADDKAAAHDDSKPGAEAEKRPGQTTEVDTEAQEDAAKERAKSGGYD